MTTPMQWFENEYDRAGVAEYVLQTGVEQGVAEEYHPGFRRMDCSVRSLGITALLHHYPYRQVYNPEVGQAEPVFYSFYRMHLEYVASNGERVSAAVEFNQQDANVRRSSDYAKAVDDQRDPSHIWDEAMAAVDAALCARAKALGIVALPGIVERGENQSVALVA